MDWPSKIAFLSAGIALLSAIIAGFASRSANKQAKAAEEQARYAKEQADAAKAQAEAAKSQVSLSKEQLELMKQSLDLQIKKQQDDALSKRPNFKCEFGAKRVGHWICPTVKIVNRSEKEAVIQRLEFSWGSLKLEAARESGDIELYDYGPVRGRGLPGRMRAGATCHYYFCMKREFNYTAAIGPPTSEPNWEASLKLLIEVNGEEIEYKDDEGKCAVQFKELAKKSPPPAQP